MTTTVSSEIQAVEKKVGIFFTAHHLVLYALLLVSLFGGYYFYQSERASALQAKATASEQALATEKQHSAELQSQSALMLQQFQQQQAERDKENATFQATITNLQQQLQQQLKKDQNLAPPALASRVDDITGFKQGTTTLDAKSNLIVPVPVAQTIVTKLDEGDVAEQTVGQQADLIKNQNTTIAQQTVIITNQNTVIANDKIVLQGQIDADQKELKAQKASARKGKLKWFGIGYVAGLVTGKFVP